MINLLPPKEKERLILEGNRKLAMVLGNIVIISLVSLFLVLFSLKFYILGEIVSQKTMLDDVEKRYQSKDSLIFKEVIEKYNKILVKIDIFYKEKLEFNKPLKYVLSVQRPVGLSLTEINMDKVKDGDVIKINISGISGTRDSLLAFKESIESSLLQNPENLRRVKNIYFPANNWIKSKDINFNFSFDYENN